MPDGDSGKREVTGVTIPIPVNVIQLVAGVFLVAATAGGGSYLGASGKAEQQPVVDAVTALQISQITKDMSDLKEEVKQLREDVKAGTDDRWTRSDHQRYSLDIEGRLRRLERKHPDLE